MSLKDLLDGDILIPLVLGLIVLNEYDSNKYRLFKNSFTILRDNFEDGGNYKNLMEGILRTGINEENKFLFDFAKNRSTEKYEHVLKGKVPIYFKFMRPFFYFDTLKELSYMKSESKKGMEFLEGVK